MPLNFHQTPRSAWPYPDAPLFRSAAPRYWEKAYGLPMITQVIDLQTPKESQLDIDRGWHWPSSCKWDAVAMHEPNRNEMEEWAERYQALISSNRVAFQKAVYLIEQAPNGTATLVHCSHGKDRTGLLIAAIMEKAGADRADILAHFEACVTALLSSGKTFRAHWQKRHISQQEYLSRFSIGAEGLLSLYQSLPKHPMPLAHAMGIA